MFLQTLCECHETKSNREVREKKETCKISSDGGAITSNLLFI